MRKWDTMGFFNIYFVAKRHKSEGIENFLKKSNQKFEVFQCQKVKGDSLSFLLSNVMLNITKNGGVFLVTLKCFQKNLSAEKSERGDHFVLPGFVCYVKNRKNEGKTLCTNSDKLPLFGSLV